MSSEYLIFNMVILGSAFLVPRMVGVRVPGGYRHWLAVGAMAVPFLVWDQIVTGWWWSFNPEYVLGLKIGRLPIEEVMFFLVVPRACLVVWDGLRLIGDRPLSGRWGVVAVLILFSGYALWYGAEYLAVVAMCLGLMYATFGELWRKRYVVLAGLVVGLTGVFNGYLTARPVVVYAPEVMIGWRIGTVPVEDFLYGLVLILGVVLIYERLRFRALD